MKTRILLILFTVLSVIKGQAQIQRCGTDDHQAALDQAFPELKAQRELMNQNVDQFIEQNPNYKAGLLVTVPVVFHILYTNATENIPDARIFEQLNVINQDYSRTNVDAANTRAQFVSVAANSQIQFCLAQRTPAGVATNGIVRVSYTGAFPNNPNTISTEWDHTKYLNIYVGNLGGGLLGYANLPPGSTGNDHVVILYSSVGGPSSPGTFPPYHLGRTITHELGHWFNLQHTFNNGCVGLNANNCATQGDFVCDTPPTANAAFGCPTNNPNTCTEVSPFPPPYSTNMVDMYENYMDYTDDGCMNIFTMGQSTRMNAAITNFRSQLLTSLGCVPVGINELLDESYVTIAPNPSNGFFEISYSLPAKTMVTLLLTDVLGKQIYRDEFSYPSIAKSTIDISNQPTGIYHLRIETANGYLVKKLVVSKQ